MKNKIASVVLAASMFGTAVMPAANVFAAEAAETEEATTEATEETADEAADETAEEADAEAETEEDAEDVEKTYPPYTKEDFLSEVFMPEEEKEKQSGIHPNKKKIILQSDPGYDKTYHA